MKFLSRSFAVVTFVFGKFMAHSVQSKSFVSSPRYLN